MKIGTEDSRWGAERKGVEVARPPITTETSVIPSLGLSFAEAEAATNPASDADADWVAVTDAAEAIHATPPITLGDAMVKLRMLAGPLGVTGGTSNDHARAIGQVSTFLATLAPVR
ncbi:hypothetical protein D3877_16020 [Azospirillum cavernae]|uniref:Uncharacterized protein n=1 Tax=Azospirillum cavernae TaxID=2320860 RepID=A0A418VWW4_9PROT|nr:hypothetical protein [Azospirillum cavernae]RJF81636.1 hypothetical protein D3877_16020 [Azospirillum cavernae]